MYSVVGIDAPPLPVIAFLNETSVRIVVPEKDEYKTVKSRFYCDIEVIGTCLLLCFISNLYNGTFLSVRKRIMNIQSTFKLSRMVLILSEWSTAWNLLFHMWFLAFWI